MRTRSLSLLLLSLLALGACAPPPPDRPAPDPAPCRDPVYQELSGTHPDSLSDRAWDRLRQLEAACRAARAEQPAAPAVDRSEGHHLGAWLWMPAMMLFGGMMWLMMGAS